MDAVAFYEKPLLKFERILITAIDHFPKGVFSFVPAMRSMLGQKIWIKQLIYDKLHDFSGPIYFPEHHMSHAASAFLLSPFKKAAILTLDGVGEWATATKGLGTDLDINLTHEIRFPHSLGLLYSAFTSYLGFKVNSAEYKIMGLAPYGQPIYAQKILDNLIDIKPDGSFNLNLKYFAYPYSQTMTSRAFHRLFEGKPRPLGAKPGTREMDLAASLQAITETVIVTAANYLHQIYKLDSICLAGGVALNCVVNGKIIKQTPFQKIFIQPAAGDAGGAVGAAAYICHTLHRHPRRYPLSDVFLGPSFSESEIESLLSKHSLRYKQLNQNQLVRTLVKLISSQKVVGLFQGRMEFGPRALGHRSILADARNPKNQKRVNKKIKFRESFRPFAPSILESEIKKWFDLDTPSPYMLLVAQSKSKKIPSVVHVDNSSRIHSVSKERNPLYWKLLKEYKNQTGVPLFINTSFNQRGEPIVCTPRNALNCFLRTNMDYLAIGLFLLDKRQMPKNLIQKAKQETFELD